VLQGTSSHYGLLRTLTLAKLSPSDIDIVYMPPEQAQTAFESGRIDAWAVWPPFIQEEQVSGRGRVLTGGDAVIQSIMAVPWSLIKNEDEIARALTEVLNKTKDWMRMHPEESQTIVAKQLGLDINVVKAAWGKHHWDTHISDDRIVNDIAAKADFLYKQGALRREIDTKKDLMYAKYDQR
jgi:sulfonate transport system substrate-binding protein